MALPPIPPRIVSLTVAFDILALFGAGIILCALLSAIFSSGVKRTAGWYSVMVGWLIYALTWGFLSINRMLTKPPPLGFCAFEMVLVNAAPVLTSFNMLCYYIEFYYIVANLRSGNLTQPVSTCCKIMLVVAPWIVFIATVVEVLLVIFLTGQLSLVEPTDSSFHCRVGNWTSSLVGGTLIAIAMIISIPLQVWTGRTLHSSWPHLRKSDFQAYLVVYIKLLVCTLFAVIAVALAFSGLFTSELQKLAEADAVIYPLLAFFMALVFGCQKDLMRPFLFWLKPSSTPATSIMFEHDAITSRSTESRTSQIIKRRGGPVLRDTPQSVVVHLQHIGEAKPSQNSSVREIGNQA